LSRLVMHWISQYATVNVSAGRGKRPKRAFWASVAAVALAALTRPQAAGTRFVTQTEHAKRATGSEGPRERVRSILGSISSHFSRFLTGFRRTVCSQRGVAPRREPSLVSGANTYPRAGLEHFRPSGAGVTAAREGADCSGFVSLYSWSLQASKPQQTGGAQHGRSSRRSAQYGCFPCRIGYRWHRTECYGHLRCRWRALKAGIGCFD
jgi:hypothetical protein